MENNIITYNVVDSVLLSIIKTQIRMIFFEKDRETIDKNNYRCKYDFHLKFFMRTDRNDELPKQSEIYNKLSKNIYNKLKVDLLTIRFNPSLLRLNYVKQLNINIKLSIILNFKKSSKIYYFKVNTKEVVKKQNEFKIGMDQRKRRMEAKQRESKNKIERSGSGTESDINERNNRNEQSKNERREKYQEKEHRKKLYSIHKKTPKHDFLNLFGSSATMKDIAIGSKLKYYYPMVYNVLSGKSGYTWEQYYSSILRFPWLELYFTKPNEYINYVPALLEYFAGLDEICLFDIVCKFHVKQLDKTKYKSYLDMRYKLKQVFVDKIVYWDLIRFNQEWRLDYDVLHRLNNMNYIKLEICFGLYSINVNLILGFIMNCNHEAVMYLIDMIHSDTLYYDINKVRNIICLSAMNEIHKSLLLKKFSKFEHEFLCDKMNNLKNSKVDSDSNKFENSEVYSDSDLDIIYMDY